MPSTDYVIPSPNSGHEDWFGSVGPEDRDAALRTALAEAGLTTPITTETFTPPDGPPIAAYVDSGDNAAINAYAREELAGGATALLFRLFRQPGPRDITAILDGLPIDKIDLHCSLRYPGQDPAELFRDLVHYLRREGYDLWTVSGSVDFDPLLDWTEPPFPPLIRLLYFVSRWMPRFRVLQVNAAGFNNGVATADVELALAVAKGIEYLRQLEARGYPPALANRHLKFAVTVGTSFYGDVAKLRALRILWAEALGELGITNPPPTRISAHTDLATLTADGDENRLRLATQALAAKLSGADQLFLAPVEGIDQSPTATGRLTARQLQVRIFTQPDLQKLPDVAYLDELTQGLCTAARNRYQRVMAQGGFAQATEF
ncbi:MAG: methylmalonyl-CoA mutase family protein [Bacteroidota bacterium]